MNAQENMDTRGIEFGFSFLKKAASFDIQFSLIDYDGSMSYGRAYLVGLLNTLLVSFIGIILCTLLGAVVGVARLSPNYLIRKTASFYIEFFRNIPLLLQIFFWYFAALRALPMPEDAPLIFGSSFMTIKGFYTPAMTIPPLARTLLPLLPVRLPLPSVGPMRSLPYSSTLFPSLPF